MRISLAPLGVSRSCPTGMGIKGTSQSPGATESAAAEFQRQEQRSERQPWATARLRCGEQTQTRRAVLSRALLSQNSTCASLVFLAPGGMAEFRIREPKWNFPDGSELKEQKSGERERGRGAAGGMIFGNAQIPFFMWREHELCQGSESKGGIKGLINSCGRAWSPCGKGRAASERK